MKVRSSVRKICDFCKIIKRHGRLMTICKIKKHKTVQGVKKRKKLKIRKFGAAA